MEKFAIRLDDITPDMNWDNFHKIKQILDEHKIKPLLGVVPDNRDDYLKLSEPREDFFAYVCGLQQEGYAIAQHGYTHIYETEDKGILNLNPFSEFAGLTYEKQYDKLQKGKKILEDAGIKVDTFMAPGHSYDKNTIKALKALGFKYITDGFSKRPYYNGGILCVPCKMLESYKNHGIDTLCFHLNRKSEADINRFRKFIEDNRSKIIDFDGEALKIYAVNKGLLTCIEERRFLLIHRLKGKLAQSGAADKYMQATYSPNSVVKLCKRVIYIPILIVRIIRNK